MMYYKHILFTIILTVCAALAFSQVKEVTDNVKEDKRNDGKRTSKSGSRAFDDDGCNCFILDFFGQLYVGAQATSLQNLDFYPDRISLETFSTFGTELSSRANFFQTGIRYNRGIFATDFKYSNLKDPGDKLKSIDWLVLNLRIPIRDFKIDYGIGYISLPDLDQRYFKSSFGFDWRLPPYRTNITATYQWSGKTTLGSRYKENYNFRVDYNMYTYKKIHLSPMFEYSFQKYFDETCFSIYNIGLLVRIF